jgi:hypothetical protein
LLSIIRRSPTQLGLEQTRWTLKAVMACCQWLHLMTAAGLCQLFKHLGISYQRGRDYIHSPDPDYEAKVDRLELLRLRAKYAPERFVFVYMDEFTFYRQPSLTQAWEERGRVQPLARRSQRAETKSRLVAALNATTGQVSFAQASAIGTKQLREFFVALRAEYPTAETIYVALDNWPVHFHPDVLVILQAQLSPWPFCRPPNWPTAPHPKIKPLDLPIQLVVLPTYASWLNPIEKLWRWLNQTVLHLHRLSDEWPTLKQQVNDFLARFARPSLDLLRYCGLLPT